MSLSKPGVLKNISGFFIEYLQLTKEPYLIHRVLQIIANQKLKIPNSYLILHKLTYKNKLYSLIIQFILFIYLNI